MQGHIPVGQSFVILTQIPAGGGAQTSVLLDSAAGIMISGSYFAGS